MGSSGGKPRKQRHHLPKVGSPANEAYERDRRRSELFGPLPLVMVAVLIVIVFAAWLVLT
ncbi:MAG: hypothetical protein ACKOYM_00330 [Actinomycetes bacterium]